MKKWKTLKKELLKDNKIDFEYSRLKPRYSVISQLIAKRIKKGITQAELAQKIGSKQSAIARLEAGEYNPSLSFLEKISQALGLRLIIQFK